MSKNAIDLDKLVTRLSSDITDGKASYSKTFDDSDENTGEKVRTILLGAIGLYSAYRRMADGVDIESLEVTLSDETDNNGMNKKISFAETPRKKTDKAETVTQKVSKSAGVTIKAKRKSKKK